MIPADSAGVLNFRDLGEAAPNLKKGLVFRCARPAAASPEGRAWLRGLGVQRWIDLRGEDERALDGPGATELYAGLPRLELARQLPAGAAWISAPLLGPEILRRGVWAESGRRERLRLVVARVAGKERAKEAALRRLSVGGLGLLYTWTLLGAQRQIAQVLAEIGRGDVGPTLFFCSVGKDRTGLVAALSLLVAGVDEADVLRDYARSGEWSERFHEDPHLREGLAERGVDPRTFLAAPPEALGEALHHIKRRFGGWEAYLRGGGFGPAEQRALRARLSSD